MMVSQLQGSFLTFLVQACKANRVLDIGTFAGYSAACMAEGLRSRGDGAKVVTLEKDELCQRVAKENIEAAGYSDLIEFLLGDASELLELLDNSMPYDLVFIDANKSGYIKYYNTILERNLLSNDGIIVADN
ncbi:3678_t:CDS:2, partial [Acaulospora colombiana]